MLARTHALLKFAQDTSRQMIQVIRYIQICPITALTVLGLAELYATHLVANSPADAIAQWHNAGGMVQYYDFPLDLYLNVRDLYQSLDLLLLMIILGN